MLAYKNGSEGSEKMKYITRLANLVIVRLIKREPPYKSPSPHGTYIRWVPILGGYLYIRWEPILGGSLY